MIPYDFIFSYMFLYLFILFLCIVCMYATENASSKSRKKFSVFCICLLAIISGFRYETGGLDYLTYRDMYERCPTFPMSIGWQENYEYGYMILTSMVKSLGLTFYGWTVVHAGIFYTCLWKGLSRYTDKFGPIMLIFLYKLFFYNTFISMRQSLTVCGFFLIMHLIQERKWWQYLLCAFLLSRLHNGAYMLIALLPLGYVELTKARLIQLNIIFIPTIALGFAGVDVMGPIGDFLRSNMDNDAAQYRIGQYFDNENLSPIGIFHTLEYFLIMFFVVKKYDEIRKFEYGEFIIKLFVCLLPLFTLLRGSEILTREKDYFTITYALIAIMLGEINHGRNKQLIYAFLTILCSFGFIRYFISFDGGELMNYRMWLFEPFCSFFN